MPKSIRAFCLLVAICIPPIAGCGAAAPVEPVRTEPEPPPPPTPVHARGDREVGGTIGPAGGSLELASGFRVEIPEGALESEVAFHLTEGAAANVFDIEDGEVGVGVITELTPAVSAVAGRTFRISAPALRAPSGFEASEVVLGMEEEGRARAFADATVTRWQYHRASIDTSRYVAEVAFFGGHRLQFGLTRDE